MRLAVAIWLSLCLGLLTGCGVPNEYVGSWKPVKQSILKLKPEEQREFDAMTLDLRDDASFHWNIMNLSGEWSKSGDRIRLQVYQVDGVPIEQAGQLPDGSYVPYQSYFKEPVELAIHDEGKRLVMIPGMGVPFAFEFTK